MEMPGYHKIPGPFKRDTEGPTRGQVNREKWSSIELESLQNNLWYFTEKVDGTNIRIGWDGHSWTYGGRTDNADLHKDLRSKLESLFSEEMFEQVFGETPAVLYGEGYGAGIQKGGGLYSPTKEFILFDVLIGGFYLRPGDVYDVGVQLGVRTVVPTGGPLVLPLKTAIDFISVGWYSQLAADSDQKFWAEGLVGTPVGGFRDRQGGRIIVKVKHADLFQGSRELVTV